MGNHCIPRLACGAALAVAAVIGVGACRNGTRGEATGAVVQAQQARTNIADARCDREQRCNRIGAGKTYADRNACVTNVQQAWRDDLTFKDCPGGVDAGKLNQCLAELRNADCGAALDRLGSTMACRTSDLCMR